MSKELLIEEFERELKLNISKMGTINYTPTTLIRMGEEFGYLDASKRLISQREETHGFTKLLLEERVELSIEALAVKPKYRSLFTERELSYCLERLPKEFHPRD